MRTILWVLILFALAAVVALFTQASTGYLLLVLPDWRVQVSLNFAIAVCVATFFALYFVFRLFFRVWAWPAQLQQKRARRWQKKAGQSLDAALAAFLGGRFQDAQKQARIAYAYSKRAAAPALLAAYAAQAMNNNAEAEKWLARAQEGDAEGVLIARARFALRNNDAAAAGQALADLRQAAAGNAAVQRLDLELAQMQQDVQAVTPLVDQLSRARLIEPERAERLREEAHLARLRELIAQPEEQRQFWQALPKATSRDSNFLRQALPLLAAAGQGLLARRFVENALKRQWDSGLARLYHLCAGQKDAAREALSLSERWLSAHADDAGLLYALGCQCMAAQLWGKAQDYLERSAALQPQAETWMALGELMDQLKRAQQAAEYYRRAAQIALQVN